MNTPHVLVVGGFDDVRSGQVRFLEEASRLGPVTVVLWPDELLARLVGQAPKFPLAERRYFLSSLRWVASVRVASPEHHPDSVPAIGDFRPNVWVDGECRANEARRAEAERHGIAYRVLPSAKLQGFSEIVPGPTLPGRKKVIVTGCYDWLHSGHVRFFEEVSTYGDVYAVVGHDANIRLLKGQGHPLLNQAERQYMVGSIRFVTQCLISSGTGWLDAEPEIQRIKPDIYAVNEDGDKGGKRDYCAEHGIEYLVLKRAPAPGLPARSSTDLRGF